LREYVLETRKYPTIRFRSRAVKATARDGTFDVSLAGELDLHGVRREVTVPLKWLFRARPARERNACPAAARLQDRAVLVRGRT
jgi:polyisoprenoid-binding protein YceI